MSESVSAVRRLMGILREAGLSPEWTNMGGNNMVVRLRFGASDANREGTACICISDRESPFTSNDYADDSSVWGFFARAYRLDFEGCEIDDDDSEGWLYCTPDDAGSAAYLIESDEDGEPVDLHREVLAVASAVLGAVADGSVKTVMLPLSK